ncbi:Cysteine-rich receptor-kinase-like protein [Quillaja saponaria]|uniref:Cysteine-rich receptor-kinase-like protein n=1 Tax=Quillaja saponaria TaxID=32244 RepID=A0AAD7M0E4_QUISA|nr:Cysteine-rich receptor-kinase-like protein [Quillaja saponaria]
MTKMLTFNHSAIPFVFLSLFFFLSLTITSEAAPTYSSAACTNDTTFKPTVIFKPNSTFQSNLNLLLSSLSSNATVRDFYTTTIGSNTPDIVNGLFLCRGDVTAAACHDCVSAASKEILRRCPDQTESIIWYDECMLRYSDQSFNNIIPSTNLQSSQAIANSDRDRFNQVLSTMFEKLATEAANSQSDKKFATASEKFSSSQTFYGLMQCTPVLSAFECNTCLRSAIAGLPSCCDGKLGARALLPGCNIRYEMHPFYNTTVPAVPPRSAGKISVSVIVAIVVPIVVSVVLFIIGYLFIRKRASKNYNAILENSVGFDSTTIESLQFEFGKIEVATNRFSDNNKIGEGGFGAVYKGILSNGQEVAVKRLSASSLQGTMEFRNEAVLVAKLQHKNLVGLLGFCFQGQEKVLVYDYVPNKSLDCFLFDPEKQRELDWSRRYKIIGGIARGLLYLHEDSRLRIIHRDLKASNVLLDANMNPKISDFGMARIFNFDQTQANTRRIVGTYGYMAPEYAMHGHYSVKSDVFSFGVLVLEIISGKRNTSFYQSHRGDDLLSYTWKHWRDRAPLELLDPTLRNSYSRNEVIRCIHISLLCVQENPADRPTMATIALMLNSYSVTLPLPQQPASFLRGRTVTGPETLRKELDSNQSTGASFPWSVNEVTNTEVYPR